MPSIKEAQQEIIDEFLIFSDWQDKYAHIIDLGRELEPMPLESKIEANRVLGCQSQVHLISEFKDGHLHFQAESDALIVQGLIAILMRIYNDRSPEDIVNTSLDFLEEIGLSSHLSTSRTNGLHSMIKRIGQHATHCL